jgi:hypothetical protein
MSFYGSLCSVCRKKGSQKWIQKLVNEKPALLNSYILEELRLPKSEQICWLSPLKSDNYAEYSDQDSLDRLGVSLKKKPLADFWPENGPQWDALGKSNYGKLFLVEAKSHIGELSSFIGAKGNSLNKILQSLSETKTFLNSTIQTNWSRVSINTQIDWRIYTCSDKMIYVHIWFLCIF